MADTTAVVLPRGSESFGGDHNEQEQMLWCGGYLGTGTDIDASPGHGRRNACRNDGVQGRNQRTKESGSNADNRAVQSATSRFRAQAGLGCRTLTAAGITDCASIIAGDDALCVARRAAGGELGTTGRRQCRKRGQKRAFPGRLRRRGDPRETSCPHPHSRFRHRRWKPPRWHRRPTPDRAGIFSAKGAKR